MSDETPRQADPETTAGRKPPPQAVTHLVSYRILAHGETIGAEFATTAGETVELLIPALMLPNALRNLAQAGQQAAQLRAGQGLPQDIIQAITAEGDPTLILSTEGMIIVSVEAKQNFPVSIAVTPAQAATLAAKLLALLQATPQAPPRH